MQIGTYHLTETTKFQVPQSFAGASQTVEVPAGDYPVTIKRDQWNQPYICVTLPGTQIYYGWFGSNTRVDTERQPYTHHLQPYGYELASWAKAGRVTLTGEYGWADYVYECSVLGPRTMQMLTKAGERASL